MRLVLLVSRWGRRGSLIFTDLRRTSNRVIRANTFPYRLATGKKLPLLYTVPRRRTTRRGLEPRVRAITTSRSWTDQATHPKEAEHETSFSERGYARYAISLEAIVPFTLQPPRERSSVETTGTGFAARVLVLADADRDLGNQMGPH